MQNLTNRRSDGKDVEKQNSDEQQQHQHQKPSTENTLDILHKRSNGLTKKWMFYPFCQWNTHIDVERTSIVHTRRKEERKEDGSRASNNNIKFVMINSGQRTSHENRPRNEIRSLELYAHGATHIICCRVYKSVGIVTTTSPWIDFHRKFNQFRWLAINFYLIRTEYTEFHVSSRFAPLPISQNSMEDF